MSSVRGRVLVVLACLALPGPALALPGRDALNAARDAAGGVLGDLNAEITVHTRAFVAEYSVNDRYLIAAAAIAMRRSNSADVCAYAGTLAADARDSEHALQTILHNYNVDARLAIGPDLRRRGMLDELAATPALTRRYLAQQVQTKKEQLILLRRYAGDGKIEAVRQFAKRQLGRINEQLSALQRLQRQS